MKKSLTLENLFEELKATNDRLDKMQRTMEGFDGDREMIVDFGGRLVKLEDQFEQERKHDKESNKDIKQEIQISADKVKSAVETQVEEIKNMVEAKTIRRKKSWWRGWFK